MTAKLESLTAELEKYRPEHFRSQKSFDVLEHFQRRTELTRDMLDALVERVEVDENMNVTIRHRYRDELDEFRKWKQQ